jgi:hypothetical protein
LRASCPASCWHHARALVGVGHRLSAGLAGVGMQQFGIGSNSGETVLARTQFIDQAVSAPQPPSPCCGVRAATGPTIRSKSAFEPGMPWIGTCVVTSSFSRLRLRYNTTALLLTLAKVPPAGGGPAAGPCGASPTSWTCAAAVSSSPSWRSLRAAHQWQFILDCYRAGNADFVPVWD